MTELWARVGYRPWARLLHRFSLHHTEIHGPLQPGGGYLERCEWCGLSRSYGREGEKSVSPPSGNCSKCGGAKVIRTHMVEGPVGPVYCPACEPDKGR